MRDEDDLEEMTELVDASFPRVDLVGKAANGTQFLIAKSAEDSNLLSPEFVRGLIAKGDDQPRDADGRFASGGGGSSEGEGVTQGGSSAFMVHGTVEPSKIAGQSTRDVNQALRETHPAPEGTNKTTITRRDGEVTIEHSNVDGARVQTLDHHTYNEGSGEHVVSRDWTAGDHTAPGAMVWGPASQPGYMGVAKSAVPVKASDLIRSAIAKAEFTYPHLQDRNTSSMTPSPRNAQVAKETPMTAIAKADDLDASEALVEEPDGSPSGDSEQPGSPAWETVDAASAEKWAAILGRAKSALGQLAQREMAEVTDPNAEVGDADQAFDLDEAACAIDCAIDLLAKFAMHERIEADLMENVEKQEALTETSPHEETSDDSAPDLSAPSLPHGDDAENDAQQTTSPTPSTEAAPADVDTNSGVAKAGDKNLMAVFTQGGKMIGVVDPEKIQAVQTGEEAPKEEAPEPAAEAPEGEHAAAPVAAPETAPAPSGEVGTPAHEVAKAAVEEVVKEALAAQAEQHSAVVKALEDRLSALESSPAPSRVLSNGALPPTNLRGMDESAGGSVDIAKAEGMRALLDSTTDATKRIAIEQEMNSAAVDALAALRINRR